MDNKIENEGDIPSYITKDLDGYKQVTQDLKEYLQGLYKEDDPRVSALEDIIAKLRAETELEELRKREDRGELVFSGINEAIMRIGKIDGEAAEKLKDADYAEALGNVSDIKARLGKIYFINNVPNPKAEIANLFQSTLDASEKI